MSVLRAHDTADPPSSDVELVVSEAVSNAINHAYVGRAPGSVRVRITMGDEEIELMVEDDGKGMSPRVDSPGLGLGLPLIAQMAERFDIQTPADGGTRLCAWFRRDPAAATMPA